MEKTIYYGITQGVIEKTRDLARIGRLLHIERNCLRDLIDHNRARRLKRDPAAVAHAGLVQAQTELDTEIAAYYDELAGFFKEAVTRYGEEQTNQLGNEIWLPSVAITQEARTECLALLKEAMSN